MIPWSSASIVDMAGALKRQSPLSVSCQLERKYEGEEEALEELWRPSGLIRPGGRIDRGMVKRCRVRGIDMQITEIIDTPDSESSSVPSRSAPLRPPIDRTAYCPPLS